MNERLKKGIDSYFEGWGTEDEYGGAIKPDWTACSLVDCNDIAQDFYSLALQDVKIELERFIREECCPGYSGINVCRDMIKFIDNLKK